MPVLTVTVADTTGDLISGAVVRVSRVTSEQKPLAPSDIEVTTATGLVTFNVPDDSYLFAEIVYGGFVYRKFVRIGAADAALDDLPDISSAGDTVIAPTTGGGGLTVAEVQALIDGAGHLTESEVDARINDLTEDHARRALRSTDLATDPDEGEVLRITGSDGDMHWGMHGRFRGAFTNAPTQAGTVGSPVVGDWTIELDGNSLKFWERVGDDDAANWNLRRTYTPTGTGNGGGTDLTLSALKTLMATDSNAGPGEVWTLDGQGENPTWRPPQGGVTIQQVQGLISTHANDEDAHHTPPTVADWADNDDDQIPAKNIATQHGNDRIPVSQSSDSQPPIWTTKAGVIDPRILEWARTGNTDRLPTEKLGTGTASSSTYLRGDGTWGSVSAGTPTSIPLYEWHRNPPARTGLFLQFLGTINVSNGDWTAAGVAYWVTSDGSTSISVGDAFDFSTILGDDARLTGGVTTYAGLSGIPIHLIPNHASLPEADGDTDGLVYQTRDLGQRFVGEEVIIAAGNRVLNFHECLAFSSGSDGVHRYRGAVDGRSGLPDPPVASDDGSVWLRRDLVDQHVAPFVTVDSDLNFQSIQTPPSGTRFYDTNGSTQRTVVAYRGHFSSEGEAEDSSLFDAAYEVAVYPDSSGNYELFFVDDDFTAGTTTTTEHRFRDTAVTQHLLNRIDALESAGGESLETIFEGTAVQITEGSGATITLNRNINITEDRGKIVLVEIGSATGANSGSTEIIAFTLRNNAGTICCTTVCTENNAGDNAKITIQDGAGNNNTWIIWYNGDKPENEYVRKIQFLSSAASISSSSTPAPAAPADEVLFDNTDSTATALTKTAVNGSWANSFNFALSRAIVEADDGKLLKIKWTATIGSNTYSFYRLLPADQFRSWNSYAANSGTSWPNGFMVWGAAQLRSSGNSIANSGRAWTVTRQRHSSGHDILRMVLGGNSTDATIANLRGTISLGR